MAPNGKCETEWLAAIVESSNDAIICQDLEGTITYWNKAAERLLGFSAEEAVGRSINILAPPESDKSKPDLHDRPPRSEPFDTICMRNDGTRVNVSVTISPIPNQTGQPIALSRFMRDITARKAEERELRRRKDELHAFLESSQIGVHRVGPDGTILWANAAELKMLGYRDEEYIGHHIAEFHADGPAITDILTNLSRGNKLYEHEARLKCKDGSIKQVLIDSSVFWEDSRFVHTQCFTRDVSQRRQAEHELRDAKQLAEQTLERSPTGLLRLITNGA